MRRLVEGLILVRRVAHGCFLDAKLAQLDRGRTTQMCDTVTSLDLYMARVLHHQQRLAEGADPLDVDIAITTETRKFLNVGGTPLPSDAFLHALSDVLSGGDPAYFKTRRRPRPPLLRHKQLTGLVTFMVETLTAGKVFKEGKAAEAVQHQLNAAGIPRPKGKPFTFSTINRWRRAVIHHAKAGDPALDMLQMQQRAMQRRHPDHPQWNKARLKEWLAEFCRDPAFRRLTLV
jgi:hypothetical protein